MYELLGVIVVLLAVITFFMPWFHRSAIKNLRQDVDDLQTRLQALESGVTEESRPVIHASLKTPEPEIVEPVGRDKYPVQRSTPNTRAQELEEIIRNKTFNKQVHEPVSEPEETEEKAPFNFEQQFGAKLPIWLGGICLALAGFFMVKYSIENSLISPAVRTLIGGLFGLALVIAGRTIFMKPGFANRERISQSLTGAGIVCLYGAFYAAGPLYHFLPSSVAFIGMICVTAAAVLLSIAQGPAVALFGMVGGFLTPILIGSDHPNTILLTIYLSVLTIGLLYVARRQNWFWMSVPIYTLSILWALGWLFGAWVLADSIWMAIYVVIVMLATPLILFTGRPETEENRPSRMVSMTGLLVALVTLSAILAKADFQPLYWGMIGIAGLGAFALAALNSRIYASAPALCAGVTTFMLFSWGTFGTVEFAVTTLAFTALYFVLSLVLTFRTTQPRLPAMMSLLVLPAWYTLSYLKIRDDYSGAFKLLPSDHIHMWPATGFAISALTLGLLWAMRKRLDALTSVDKDMVLGLGSLISLGFVTFSLYLLLSPEHLMIAYALQLLAITWLLTRFDFNFITVTRNVAAGLLGVTLLEHAQEIISLVSIREYALFDMRRDALPVGPLFAVALMVGAAGVLAREAYMKKIAAVTCGTLVLSLIFAFFESLGGHRVAQNVLYPEGPANQYLVRACTLNVVWVLALGGAWLASMHRDTESMKPWLIGYAMFQTIIVDLFFYFPDAGASMGQVKVFNTLILAFATPALAMLAARMMFEEGAGRAKWLLVSGLAYLFLFVTLEVSHAYHVPHLSGQGARSLAEIFTYSVAWLLYGIAVLLWGTAKQDKMLRVGALLIIGLTVVKVFLYDTSELDGILRVLSFLGLGISLIGLGFFYTRYVAAPEKSVKSSGLNMT